MSAIDDVRATQRKVDDHRQALPYLISNLQSKIIDDCIRTRTQAIKDIDDVAQEKIHELDA
jgi:hypothetical protein